MTLALADDLFLLAHDVATGRTRVTDQALASGLAGALLTELLFSGCVVLADGVLHAGERPPPPDPVARALAEQLGASMGPDTPVAAAAWLAALRPTATEQVAERLVTAGRVQVTGHRRLGRASFRYHPVRSTEVFMRGQRLSVYLCNRLELTELDVMLAALATRMSPGGDLLELDGAGRDHLDQLVPLLPPSLRELLDLARSVKPGSR